MTKHTKKQQRPDEKRPKPQKQRPKVDDVLASDLAQKAREEGEKVYREKQIRKQILEEFQAISNQQSTPNTMAIVSLVVKHLDHIDLARDILSSRKKATNPWSVAIWGWLSLSNEQIESRLREWNSNREQALVEDAKLCLQHNLPNPLFIQIPTTTDGPAWGIVEPDRILGEIKKAMRNDSPQPTIQGKLEWNTPGEHIVELRFETGDIVPINVDLQLELDPIPEALVEAWEKADILPLNPNKAILASLQHYLEQGPQSTDRCTWLARILKTAHTLGYWKTDLIQQILAQWELELKNRTVATTSNLPALQVMEQGRSSPEQSTETPYTTEAQLGWDMIIEGDSEEAKRLRILNLPPLMAYDLITSSVDFNVLQHLLAASHLAHLRGKKLEEFTDEDIRDLSYGVNKEIRNIRYRPGKSVGSLALANILLSVARLQFDRLETGTSEAAIRFCLSGYSTRMGEYLIREHNRYDVARDYYLEAISLNLVSLRGVDFPTFLLFRSFFPNAKIHSREADPSECLRLFESKGTPQTFETASRSFLELGSRHFSWAAKWFGQCSKKSQDEILTRMRKQLGLSDTENFTDCTNVYVQTFARFQSLLHQKYSSTSAHSIVEIASEFEEQLNGLGFLVSPTNHEIAALLIQAADAIKAFLKGSRYEHRRNSAHTALTLLERILAYEHDNSTALWAAYFRPIAHQWRATIKREIEQVAQEITPKIDLKLAESNISLTDPRLDGGHPRVIVRIENTGSGTADRVNVRFSSPDGKGFTLTHKDLRIEPGERQETYFDLDFCKEDEGFKFDYTISYYDPDRRFVEQPSTGPITVEPLTADPLLERLVNPFNPGQEVTDECMFVGRDQKLEEVANFAISNGGLLMLHGQKRVGKSSFLIFLERRLDRDSIPLSILPVRVQWLDYSKHLAWMVMEEIANKIQSKAKSLLNQVLPLPNASDFEKSYTFAFNRVLRSLADIGIQRLILMIDEFDVIVHQLDRTELAFDRSFFEYLRGLSKQSAVTLILTGGEMMPILFERLGEVFNHDRPWRIDYLSRTDGSIERLVRNDYICGVLNFSDEAIEAIKEFSACNPFFVQMICKELVELECRPLAGIICS